MVYLMLLFNAVLNTVSSIFIRLLLLKEWEGC